MRSLSSLYLIGGILILFSSCVGKSDALTFIPEEAPVVLSFNVQTLADKANFEEWDQLEFMEAAEDEIRGESKRLSRRLDRLREDPKSGGMDLRKDVYMFMGGDKQGENYVGFAIDMLDRDDFEEMVKGILDETDTYYEHKKVNEHRVFLIQRNDAAIIYNKKRILFLVPSGHQARNDVVATIRDLTALGSRNQLTKDQDFRDFLENSTDLGLWVSGSFAENSLSQRELRKMKEQLGYDITDNSFASHVTFKKNKISMDTRSYLGQESSELLARWNLMTRTVEGDLLEFLPGDAVAAAGISFSMEGMRNALSEEEQLTAIKERIDSDPNSVALLEAFNGDMVFDLYGFKEVTETYTDYETFTDSLGYRDYREVEKTRVKRAPMLAIAVGIENKLQFTKVVEELVESKTLQQQDDHYKMDMLGRNVYLAYKEAHAILTSDEELVRAYAKNGEVKNNLGDTDVGDEIDDNWLYAMVDLDAERFSNEIDEEFNTEEKKVMELADDYAKRLVMSSENQELHVTLEVHPGEGNSLWRLFKLIDEGYKESRNH